MKASVAGANQQRAQAVAQAIRWAFWETPVQLGVPKPITVSMGGKAVQFMARQDAAKSRNSEATIHLAILKRGRILQDLDESWLLASFKLDGRNNLVEEGLPKVLSDDEAEAFRAAFEAPASVESPVEVLSPAEASPTGLRSAARPSLADQVMAVAQERYEKGWDVVVETLDRAELDSMLRDAKTLDEALAIVERDVVSAWEARREGVVFDEVEPSFEGLPVYERFTPGDEVIWERHLEDLRWHREDAPGAYERSQTDDLTAEAEAEMRRFDALFSGGRAPEGISQKALYLAWHRNQQVLGALEGLAKAVREDGGVVGSAVGRTVPGAEAVLECVESRWLGDRRVSGETRLEALKDLLAALQGGAANSRVLREAVRVANECVADGQGRLKTLEELRSWGVPLSAYLAPGDRVEEAIVDEQRGEVPPAHWTGDLLLVGEPAATDWQGQPLFDAFRRHADECWYYEGRFRLGQTEPDVLLGDECFF